MSNKTVTSQAIGATDLLGGYLCIGIFVQKLNPFSKGGSLPV